MRRVGSFSARRAAPRFFAWPGGFRVSLPPHFTAAGRPGVSLRPGGWRLFLTPILFNYGDGNNGNQLPRDRAIHRGRRAGHS